MRVNLTRNATVLLDVYSDTNTERMILWQTGTSLETRYTYRYKQNSNYGFLVSSFDDLLKLLARKQCSMCNMECVQKATYFSVKVKRVCISLIYIFLTQLRRKTDRLPPMLFYRQMTRSRTIDATFGDIVSFNLNTVSRMYFRGVATTDVEIITVRVDVWEIKFRRMHLWWKTSF